MDDLIKLYKDEQICYAGELQIEAMLKDGWKKFEEVVEKVTEPEKTEDGKDEDGKDIEVSLDEVG